MSDDPYDGAAVTPERLGGAAFLLIVPVFGYLGIVLFDDVAFGGIVGLAVGAGTFLFLPYFVYGAAVREAGMDPPSTEHSSRAAAGMALSNGGIVALGARFVFEGAFLIPVAVGAVFAVGQYFVIERLLPPIGEGTDTDA